MIKLVLHKDFAINRRALNPQSLKDFANQIILEGEVYEQEVGTFIVDWLSDDEFIIVNTSGSTGKPKAIKVYKQHMINSALATGKFFKVEAGTTALLCLSASYIAGKMMLVRAMVLGWKIDLVPPKTNPLDAVSRHYDFCAMVPLQLDNSLNRLHVIKKLIVGGGAVSERLKELVHGINTKIYETYGMTETVSHIAARRINPKKKKETSYFKALPNITLSIDDRKCLLINAPELKQDTISTNDVVELKSYKKFIWKGRYDNVINSGGVKLFPEEIETKLQLLISPRFFISAIPDDALGDRLVLIIEQEFDKTRYEFIKEGIHTIKTLSKYEIPKEIYFTPQFIETETGKLQRAKTLQFVISQPYGISDL